MSIDDAIKLARKPLRIETHTALKGNSHAMGGGPNSHPLAADDRASERCGQ